MGRLCLPNGGNWWTARLCAFGEKLRRRQTFDHRGNGRAAAQGETLETDNFNKADTAFLAPRSILIASSNNTFKTALVDILLRAGHHVSIIDDARMILDASDLGETDLMIVDVNISEMSGSDVIKLYRFMSLGLRYIPIIAVGSDAPEEHCKEAGIDACINLSAGEHDLLNVIDKLIARAGKNSQRVSNHQSAQYRAMDQLGCAAPIDAGSLENLAMLGGLQLVDDLVAAFIEEVPIILCSLRDAVLLSDCETFHEQMHLLRSHAANIGAGALYQMCSEWGQTTPENITPPSEAIISNLGCEFDRASVALQKMLREQRFELHLTQPYKQLKT
jgi:two-component system sensor histidine kinase RpfC